MKKLVLVTMCIIALPLLGCAPRGPQGTTSFYQGSPQQKAEEYCNRMVGDPRNPHNAGLQRAGASAGIGAGSWIAGLGVVNPVFFIAGLGTAIASVTGVGNANERENNFHKEYAACMQQQMQSYYAKK